MFAQWATCGLLRSFFFSRLPIDLIQLAKAAGNIIYSNYHLFHCLLWKLHRNLFSDSVTSHTSLKSATHAFSKCKLHSVLTPGHPTMLFSSLLLLHKHQKQSKTANLRQGSWSRKIRWNVFFCNGKNIIACAVVQWWARCNAASRSWVQSQARVEFIWKIPYQRRSHPTQLWRVDQVFTWSREWLAIALLMPGLEMEGR